MCAAHRAAQIRVRGGTVSQSHVTALQIMKRGVCGNARSPSRLERFGEMAILISRTETGLLTAQHARLGNDFNYRQDAQGRGAFLHR
jgi:hypothetical protein